MSLETNRAPQRLVCDRCDLWLDIWEDREDYIPPSNWTYFIIESKNLEDIQQEMYLCPPCAGLFEKWRRKEGWQDTVGK